MKPINIIRKLNESNSLTFDDCPISTPKGFKPDTCWYGEGNAPQWKYKYKKDNDIYLKYYDSDEFSIGSEENFKICSKIASSSKSKSIKDEERKISDVWDEYMYSLNDYSDYSADEIISMCDNLSSMYKSFISKYGKNINEADHENKPEDFTNVSDSFDNIFLNGDYIRSNNGYSLVHTIQDDGSHIIKANDNDIHYNAYSADGINWIIAFDRTPKYNKEGKPIDIAKYLIQLNDKLNKGGNNETNSNN